METSLLHLVFYIATLCLAHVAQHLAEHPLQRVVAHGAAPGSLGGADSLIAVIADVEGGAVEVAGVLGGVGVARAQFLNVAARAQHAGNDYLVQGYALYLEAVIEGTAY